MPGEGDGLNTDVAQAEFTVGGAAGRNLLIRERDQHVGAIEATEDLEVRDIDETRRLNVGNRRFFLAAHDEQARNEQAQPYLFVEHLLFHVIARHSPLSVFVQHGCNRLKGNLLILERGIELNDDIFPVWSSGQSGSVAL